MFIGNSTASRDQFSDITNKTYHHHITLQNNTTFFLTICCSLVTSKYIYVFPTLFMWSLCMIASRASLCMYWFVHEQYDGYE